MSKTPAPWQLEPCGCYNVKCKGWLAGPRLHAEAVYSEADARLIAAAPELLAAIKPLLQYTLDVDTTGLTKGFRREILEWVRAAEAAIIKAETNNETA